jgi:iron complex outermembrane receptor protein
MRVRAFITPNAAGTAGHISQVPGRGTVKSRHPIALGMRCAFASSILVIVAAGRPALAEDQPALQEVVVTGTRISSPGVTANSPVASVSAQEIQFQQPSAVEELIKTLPAAGVGVDANINNGSGGGATIDLRSLGPNRSLVLVNGRRIVPFDLVGAVDTNSIPLALIERFDLVTGGASAVYGADAVAGVVNFILKRNFEGLDLSASSGMSGQHDARRYSADATLGTNVADGRGNVVLSIGYTETDPLLQGARDFGKVALSSTTGAPQGSGTAVPLIITSPNLGLPGGQAQIDPSTGKFVPVYQTYNFNPTNFYVAPLRRTQGTALGHYEINDHAEAYAELFYTRSDVITQLASSGTFLNVYSVPIGNPYIPDPARQEYSWPRTAAGAPITNLLNKKPPIVGNTIGTTAYNSGNTFPAFYDPVGRYFTLAATVQF